MDKNKIISVTALITAIIDQIIKFFITTKMDLYQTIPVIKNFFNITYVNNEGAAFSILDGKVPLLVLATLVICYILYTFFIKNEKINLKQMIIYGILYGGIFGNLIDRMFRSYVVDYLDFSIFGKQFAIFNFADSCIVVSILLVLILMLRGEKNEIRNK